MGEDVGDHHHRPNRSFASQGEGTRRDAIRAGPVTAGPRADPDVALMLQLQAGAPDALGELLRRNHGSVLNLAYRYLGDRDQAEDVVQETFLKLYQARGRYRPEARFRTYLLRIATNVCISQLRRRRARPFLTAESGATPELPDGDAPAPDGRALEDELGARVRDAVAALPERQRVAILLNKFEGLGYEGVAEVLGLSVPATKSLLHRARLALREALAPYVTGPEEPS